MELVLISDTHGQHRKITVPPGDSKRPSSV